MSLKITPETLKTILDEMVHKKINQQIVIFVFIASIVGILFKILSTTYGKGEVETHQIREQRNTYNTISIVCGVIILVAFLYFLITFIVKMVTPPTLIEKAEPVVRKFFASNGFVWSLR